MEFKFFLMSQKGFIVLNNLLAIFPPSIIKAVIGSRDKNVQKDYYNEIQLLCNKNKITFIGRDEYSNIQTDYSFAISWRWIINDTHNLIVLHDSILPYYRGFAPLVNSLINKEKHIGVTALFASKEFDLGDIIASKKTIVIYPIKIKEAIDIVSELYSALVCEILETIIKGKPLKTYTQVKEVGSYSLWLDEEDYMIDWSLSSHDICRFIDAVGYPYQGAATNIMSTTIRIIDSTVVQDYKIENRTPGKVLFIENGEPIVVCGKGLLKITKATNEAGISILPFRKLRTRFK